MAVLLYLVRHGVAEEPGEAWPDDSKRPLTAKGKARLREVAQGLLALDVQMDEVVTSPFVRARQTAEILASAYADVPPVTLLPALAVGGAPGEVLSQLGRFAKRQNLGLVGHAPGIGELAARLIGARRAFDFRKGAVCCIEVDALTAAPRGRLRWFLTPRMLRQIGRTG
jgi:phosphohistidine phosphatase